ncbi:hypothetical protein [Leucobacter sp. GX24907]
MRRGEREAAQARDRMPYIMIEQDLWAVLRYRRDQPAAMIRRITDRNEIAKYLVLTWHPDPHRWRLIAMYDSIEEANGSVLWESSGIRTGRESHRPPTKQGYIPQETIDGAPHVPLDTE